MADLNSTLVRGNLRVTDETIGYKFHSNASASTNLSTIPDSSGVALETGNGDGSVSAWIWREKWDAANYGIFHDNSADALRIVGSSTEKATFNLTNGDFATSGTIYEAGTALSNKYLALSGGTMTGTLNIYRSSSSSGYDEGIRIHANANTWTTLMLCGTDNTGDYGTSSNSWGIFNHNGQFYITRNGSDNTGSAQLKCENGNWNISNLTIDGNTVITSANIGSQSVANATTAGGLHVHSGRNNEANKIVRTDSNGYLLCGYINSDSGDENNSSAPARIWGTNGSDSYLRTYNASYVSVGYASSAGSASSAGATDSFGSAPNDAYRGGKLTTFYSWNAGGPANNYCTGITVGGHPNDQNYGWQMAQSLWSDDLYYRRYDAANISGGWTSWIKILTPSTALAREAWWTSSESHSPNDLGSGITFAYTDHGAPTTGTLVAFAGEGGTCESYRLQIQGGYSDNRIYYRNRNGDAGTWNSWCTVVIRGDSTSGGPSSTTTVVDNVSGARSTSGSGTSARRTLTISRSTTSVASSSHIHTL